MSDSVKSPSKEHGETSRHQRLRCNHMTLVVHVCTLALTRSLHGKTWYAQCFVLASRSSTEYASRYGQRASRKSVVESLQRHSLHSHSMSLLTAPLTLQRLPNTHSLNAVQHILHKSMPPTTLIQSLVSLYMLQISQSQQTAPISR